MSTEIIKQDESVLAKWTDEQVSLIKSQVAPKATDNELQLFLYVAAKRKLDPLSRQIYAIHRETWNPDTKRKEPKMTIQTSIDGFRAIAERSGCYAPGSEQWTEDERGYPVTATVSVRKFAKGVWIEYSATAHFSEYAQSIDDGKGLPKFTGQWGKMPHVMIAKCAEAKALRKGWPEQLDGIYVDEEMQQADEHHDRFSALPAEDQPKHVVITMPAQVANRVSVPPKTVLPPIPDKLTTIPDEILKHIEPLRPLQGIEFKRMATEDLELVAEQAKLFQPKLKTEQGKSWLRAIEAEARHRRDMRDDPEPPPQDEQFSDPFEGQTEVR